MSISPKRSHLFSLLRNRLAHKGALIALAAWSLGAANYMPPDNYEEEEAPTAKWEEVALKLPEAPQDANLVAFYVGPTARMQFFVDTKSISASSDGIVRYTMVSKSASGAVNVTYEGIRCQTIQKKQYAFGRADGTWGVSRRDQWSPITENVANRQDAALAKDYLCQDNTIAGSVEDIVKRFKSRRTLTPAQDYGPNR